MRKKSCAFVNYGNSREGEAIANALKSEGYIVFATRRPDPSNLDVLQPDPLSVDQFIDSSIDSIVSTMKMCSLIIYTILDTPKIAIEAFKLLNDDPGVKKNIVVVSPIFTWCGTPKAEDWHKRWSYPRYAEHLAAERFLTSSLTLRINVICVGLLYGDGEGPLFPLFQAAWNGHQIPVFNGNSNNIIPTLHVRDMANAAVALANNRTEASVIIAHDGSGTTQSALIKSINQAFGLIGPSAGGAKRQKVSESQLVAAVGREAADWLLLDFNLECEDYNGLEFERHASAPIDEEEGAKIIVDEFVQKRLLRPITLVTFGVAPEYEAKIREEYGLEDASLPALKAVFALDKSDIANELRDSAGEEEEVSDSDIIKHVLSTNAKYRLHGFLIPGSMIPADQEAREGLLLEEEEKSSWFPRYVITTHSDENDNADLLLKSQNIASDTVKMEIKGKGKKSKRPKYEEWFISKGSHCKKCISMIDVEQFLGLPHNLTRTERILNERRRIEQEVTERAKEERMELKRQREEEEKKRQELAERDQKLLREVEEEIRSMQEIREENPREFLMNRIVGMFQVPLEQLNEARPDDPLRFLASHFEKVSKEVK